MFIYSDCSGELYATEKKQTTKQRRCSICGTYATFIGEANNSQEAWEILEPLMNYWDDNVCMTCPNFDDDPVFASTCQDCEMFQSQMGYDYEYLANFIYHYFGDS